MHRGKQSRVYMNDTNLIDLINVIMIGAVNDIALMLFTASQFSSVPSHKETRVIVQLS